MDKIKKIGLFQTWNKSAGMVEWSLTRMLQLLVLIYWGYFDRFYMNLVSQIDGVEPKITVNFIFLNLVFLIAAFMPKYLKDLIDIKNKIG